MAKRTPLYDTHVSLGGKIVDFAGYDMPVQYSTGIIAEHNAVRTNVGLFDCSHMGEFFITGEDAEKALNYILTNNFAGMLPGRVRYSPMCYENGGVVDDVLVYKYDDKKFMIVVNASNEEKDAGWFRANLSNFDVKFTNESIKIGLVAVQGPKSDELLNLCASTLPEKYYTFLENVDVCGKKCLVSRTGYTGEKGYEIYCKAKDTESIFLELLKIGKEMGVIPCGLGARDTLRLEAGLPLYGHELSPEIPVLETGLDFAVKMDKNDFIGKKALLNHQVKYTRVGGILTERGIAREGAEVYFGNKQVGYVTSGSHSPTLGKSIMVLRILKDYSSGVNLTVAVRDKRLGIELVPLPFYKSESK